MPFLRPDGDAVAGNWLNQVGASALAGALDEVSADDADYIQSGENPTGDIARVSLSDGAIDTSAAVTVRYRIGGTPGASLTVRLKQGAAVIATWQETLPAAPTTVARVLSAGERAAITDGADLFLEFEANTGPQPSDYNSPVGDVQADLVLDFNAGPYYAADTGSGLVAATQAIISGFSALETVGGVTRLRTDNGDTPTVALSSFDFSTTQGTVLCVGRFDDVQAFNRIWQIDGGSATDRFGSYFSSGIQARAFMEESDIENALITKVAAYTSDTVMALAISWGASGLRVSFDGDAVISDADIVIPTGMTTLRLGHSSASDAPGGGIRRLVYWNTQLADADLVALAGNP